MEMQCACSLLPNRSFASKFSTFQFRTASLSSSLRKQAPLLRYELKLNSRLRKGETVSPLNISSSEKLSTSAKENSNVSGNGISGFEPFRGKSGSVSFVGLTHQLVEENKPESAPFVGKAGSFLWTVAPLALISSFVLPQFVIDVVVGDIKNKVVSEFLATFISEAMFYVGVGIFLSVTDRVQRPYLEFSAERWSLITGLRGYLASAIGVMGIKTFFPFLALCVTWPVLGIAAFVAVAPFLVGCLVQFVFERLLEEKGSSCWPLVPIIFEVYRFYQLTRAISFVQKLLYAASELPQTPAFYQKNGALVSLMIIFQLLGLTCLWSLLTFLQRLFPSRPVASNY